MAKEAKEAKLASEKLAKEAKLASEKLAKEEKLASEKLAKDEKLASETKPKKVKVEVAKKTEVAKKVEVAKKTEEKAEVKAEVKKVTVSRITIKGVQYLKSSTNLLYNPETKEEIGIYDPDTQTIKELPDDDEDEVSDSDYESE